MYVQLSKLLRHRREWTPPQLLSWRTNAARSRTAESLFCATTRAGIEVQHLLPM